MDTDAIRSRFDGRGQVELRLGAEGTALAGQIAYALGYELVSAERQGGTAAGALGAPYRTAVTFVLHFRRDDDPRARRRAELTVERLRAGGPVLPDGALDPPAPPPPAPAPPLVPRPPEPRPRRSLEPQPPPPAPTSPPGPRIPLRPAYPPAPPPPPPVGPGRPGSR
ncbi:hypothetical protein [Streptomyces sp. NPDC048665]|uniref:hypothetical protein n=1 Tax=Streptomyces sp. NPDC048665 TaxID=3155490 RepID=UPI00343A9A62